MLFPLQKKKLKVLERDHFLAVLKKNQGVDVCLDLVEDAQTGIVYLETFEFYY